MLTAAEREQIRLLAADIPAVWDAPTTTAADRKKLIRHLVEQLSIAVAGVSERVDVDIAWVGGHHTQGQVVRPVAAGPWASVMRSFLNLCGTASTTACAFSAGTPAATRAKFATLLGRLRNHPVTAGTPPQTFTYAATISEVHRE